MTSSVRLEPLLQFRQMVRKAVVCGLDPYIAEAVLD